MRSPEVSRGGSRPTSPLVVAACLVAVLAAGGLGCAPQGDRCYVEPARHESARRLYARAGSLELVERTLAEADWLPCEIEQTIYRLKKENGLE